MAARFADKVAIVVGAGSSGPGWGNGKATAALLAREGAQVVAVDVNRSAAEETVDIIREEGFEATPHCADVTRADNVATMVEACLAKYGRIDLLHHNVGVARVGGPVEMSEDAWNQVLAVNLTSCFLTLKFVLPVMERQGAGAIVATSSIAAIRYTGVLYISYYATKAALVQMMQSVALHYATKGIRANTVLPGLMNTPMIFHGLPDVYADGNAQRMVEVRAAQCPTGKMGDAWDTAHAVAFLLSDEAKYVTGTSLVVDGGITAKYV